MSIQKVEVYVGYFQVWWYEERMLILGYVVLLPDDLLSLKFYLRRGDNIYCLFIDNKKQGLSSLIS